MEETTAASLDETGVGQATVAGHDEPSSAPIHTRVRLEPGDSVGRYVVVAKLGAGGMGEVYAAYDPELDRKIALKVLRSDGRVSDAGGHLRLLREAQALAKFTHPNIVTIHDVGEHARGVWIAMEYVEGRTLAAWAKLQERSWPEVLRVMIAAGRGVMAAHATGLMHRDLKPDNVMIGADGRVRVMDFGLTRTLEPSEGEPVEIPAGVGSRELASTLDPLATPVTQFGSLLGTPAYMSPEQFAGVAVSAASDQFSYCVTLWELLYGVRPFQGKTVMSLAAAVLEGTITQAPGRGVPAWLNKVVRRGLAARAEDRWPSMAALLSELEQGQQRRRRRNGVVVGLGVAGLIAGLLGFGRYREAQFEAGCARQSAEVARVWNDDARARVRDGLLASEVGNAASTADLVLPWLDRYAEAWADAKAKQCLAGRDAKAEAALAERLERTSWCLEDRLTSVAALIEQLAHADKATVYATIPAAIALPNIDACSDAQTIANQPIPAADQREAIREVRAELARASALEQTGKASEALPIAEQALRGAEAIDWIPVRARARMLVAELLRDAGRREQAETLLEQAFFEALDAGSYEDAFTIATEIATLAGAHKGSGLRDGERWLRLADWLDHRLGDSGFRQAAVLNARGVLAMTGGDFKRGLASYAGALERSEAELGTEHPLVAANVLNLANANLRTGNYAEALRHYDRAIVIYEATLGPEHPMLALAVANSVAAYKGAGDYERALAVGERALAMRIALYGRNHVEVGSVLENIANTHVDMQDYVKAADYMSQALAVTEATAGTEGAVYARNLINLGALQVKTGEYVEAKANFARSLEIHEALYGPDSMMPFYSLVNLAEVSLALDEDAEALVYAERATTLGETMGVDAQAIGEAKFFLAQALWRADPRSARARTLAGEARDHYRDGGAPTAARLREAEAFIAKIAGG